MDEDEAMSLSDGAAAATCGTCGHVHENEDGTCSECSCKTEEMV